MNKPLRKQDQVASSTPRAALSQSDLSVQNIVAGVDAEEFRLWFAPKFAQFLQSNFATPEHVAFHFQVRNSTAWNWWNGDNRASGNTVALAFLTFPQAVGWFLAEWEARQCQR